MRIQVNGEPHELATPLTVAALLERLGIDPRRVAVEHNLTVVKRADYDRTMVQEADEVEIVNFVGGGSLEPARAAGGKSAPQARTRERERAGVGPRERQKKLTR